MKISRLTSVGNKIAGAFALVVAPMLLVAAAALLAFHQASDSLANYAESVGEARRAFQLEVTVAALRLRAGDYRAHPGPENLQAYGKDQAATWRQLAQAERGITRGDRAAELTRIRALLTDYD
jgi:hypothetical protein